ncbi:Uncharacterised protein g10965 [Pycnogonum litorale]
MLSHTECLIFFGIIFVSHFTSSSGGTVKLGKYCNVNSDCADKLAFCSYENYCKCSLDTKMINDKCWATVDTIGGKCGPLDIVTSKNAECRNGIVQCKSGYHQGGSNCVNDKGAAIGEACFQDSDCTVITDRSVCDFHNCACPIFSNVVTVDGKPTCTQQVYVGKKCDGKYTTCWDSDSQCKDGTCQCKPGYYSSSSGLCFSSFNNLIIISSVVPASLITISIVSLILIRRRRNRLSWQRSNFQSNPPVQHHLPVISTAPPPYYGSSLSNDGYKSG